MFKENSGKPPTLLQRIFYWVDDYSPIVLLNATWFVVTLLPVGILVVIANLISTSAVLDLFWLFGLLLLLTGLPTTGALFYAMNELANERGATFTKFFEGFKEHFWLSYKWGLPSVAIIAILVFNIFFYGQLEGSLAVVPQMSRIAQLLSVVMLVIFSGMQLYLFPLLLEQQTPSFKNAIRNSFLIYVRFPLHTFGLLLLVGLLLLLSVVVTQWLWPLLTAGLSTYLANRLLIHLVGRMPRKEQQK